MSLFEYALLGVLLLFMLGAFLAHLHAIRAFVPRGEFDQLARDVRDDAETVQRIDNAFARATGEMREAVHGLKESRQQTAGLIAALDDRVSETGHKLERLLGRLEASSKT